MDEITEKTTSASDLDAPDGKEGRSAHTPWQAIYELFEMVVISVAAIFIIFMFVGKVAVVNGNSMLQTLKNNDKLFVWELFYTPKQGDIIVCQSEYKDREALVKRVIAVEGQKIKIDSANWAVYVDGILLDESDYVNYIPDMAMGNGNWLDGEFTIPEGKVFVMGDNRTASLDSRAADVGIIDENWIMGKVVYRLFPIGSLGTVD